MNKANASSVRKRERLRTAISPQIPETLSQVPVASSVGDLAVARRATYEIQKVSHGSKVRIGTLAWQLEDDDHGSLSEFEFLETLRAISGKKPDLILCAGMTIWTRRPSRKGFDPAKDFAKSICSAAPSPVLFEWEDGSWMLAHDDKLTTIRLAQRLASTEESKESAFLVVGELCAGYGTIDVVRDKATARRLVLLICGEASILKNSTPRSLVEKGRVGGLPAPVAFMSPWVLLHPSHRPYGNHTKNDGFAMVGEWNDGNAKRSAWLQVFVENTTIFADNTQAPNAAIHAGNYRDWSSKHGDDIDYSTLCFERGASVARIGKPIQQKHPLAFRYAEFSV